MSAPTDERAPEAPARHLASPRPGPSRRWMAVFSGLLVVALLAGAVLTYVGVQTVRTSRAGKSVSTVSDPSLPGFEAFLEPTPTLLMLHATAGSTLVSVAVLALNSGDVGGSVLLVPPDTRVDTGEDAFSLDAISAFGGSPAGVLPGLQDLLGIGLAEVVVVDDAKWAELVAPVAPLTIENPDAVGEFEAGSLTLMAEQVGPYLAARATGESDLARLYRQSLVFEAWAAAVAASADPDAVPGEVESGIGRFVRGLAGGPRQIATLPVTETPTAQGTVRIDVDSTELTELVASLIAFPTAARAGGRIRVRLVDGAGDSDNVLRAAPLVVRAGSQIIVVGNADRFDYQTTEVRYHDRTSRSAAEALRDALGVGRVIDDPRPTDAFDVTIVLGPEDLREGP